MKGFQGFVRSAGSGRRLARRRGRVLSVAFAGCALVAALALAGCGGVRVRPQDQVPPPLVDELPLRAGVYYSPEFRSYVHREERWGTKWEAELGGAHVTKLNRLLGAMFPQLVEVPDLARPPQPPLQLIIEPRFEEYSFITPRDAGAEYYAVTIKYRMNLYDGQARLIDSLVYTGYGSEEGGGLTTEAPLIAATQKAMRDAGAKFATEFADQATVKKLLAGQTVEPVQGGNVASPAAGVLDEVAPSAVTPGVAILPSGGPVAPAAPATSAPGAVAPASPPAAPATPGAGEAGSKAPGSPAAGDPSAPNEAAPPPGGATPSGSAPPPGNSPPSDGTSAPGAAPAPSGTPPKPPGR